MAATAAEVTRVRAMVNEPTTDSYSDAQIAAAIERYPLVDGRGEEPFVWSLTRPPAQQANPDWVETYDLHNAAADLYEEKGAVLAQDYDFNADGGSYQRSQAYEQTMAQARYYRSRRAPASRRVVVEPSTRQPVVTNTNNPYE